MAANNKSSEDEEARIREILPILDRRPNPESIGDDSLAVQDIGSGLQNLGFAPTMEETQKLVERYAAGDETKRLTYHELLLLYREQKKKQQKESMPKSADLEKRLVEYMSVIFGVENTDAATINVSTLRLCLATMGEKLSDDEISQLFHGFHVGGDGEISIEEFARHITQI